MARHLGHDRLDGVVGAAGADARGHQVRHPVVGAHDRRAVLRQPARLVHEQVGHDHPRPLLGVAAADGGADIEISDSQHDIDNNQVTNKGRFTVTPTSEQSELFAIGTELNIITKVEQAGTITHFHGKKILTVKKATLR